MKYLFRVSTTKCILGGYPLEEPYLEESYSSCVEGIRNIVDNTLALISLTDKPVDYIITFTISKKKGV